jgi:hypothetical protein
VPDDNVEIAREEWRKYFDGLNDEVRGSEVTIEVLTNEYGDQYEAEKLPLDFVEYDDKDDVFIVAVGGRDRRYPSLRHLVNHPTRMLTETVLTDVPWALEVEAADDSRTIVTFYRPPALPR